MQHSDNWGEMCNCHFIGNGDPRQYSCLENPMDGRAWQATVHGVTKNQTRLSDFRQQLGFPGGSESTCNAGDLGLIPG